MATGRERATLALAAAVIVLAMPTTVGQLGAIALGALVGLVLLRTDVPSGDSASGVQIGRGTGAACLLVFFGLLIGLPILASQWPHHWLALVSAFYSAGSLVFGGGHVVLPLLQAAVVPPGWVGNDLFLAGYGAAQAVPGPLFTFAAYLGAVMGPVPNGWAGAAICLVAIFVPSFLLVIGVPPYWEALRARPAAQAALKGVNAAVVGLLLAALYNPVWKSAIVTSYDFALAIAAFLLLSVWKTPPWLVVVLCALGGAALARL